MMRYMIIMLMSLLLLSACNSTEAEPTSESELPEIETTLSVDDPLNVIEEIPVEDIIEELVVQEPVIVRILADKLNVREAITKDSDIVGVVIESSAYEVLEISYDEEERPWYLIGLEDGNSGWIAGWYCSEVTDHSILGEFVSSYDITETNTLMEVIESDELILQGALYEVEDIKPGDAVMKSKILQFTPSKDLLEYEYVETITLGDEEVSKVDEAVFIGEDRYLYLTLTTGNEVYLMKGYVGDWVSEVLYSIGTLESSHYYSWFGIKIVDKTDIRVAFKIDDDLIIYNVEEDMVEHHYRYESQTLIDFCLETSEVIVTIDGTAYVADYNLDIATEAFRGNGIDGERSEAPGVSFGKGDGDRLDVRMYGWESVYGSYIYDRSNETFLSFESDLKHNLYEGSYDWEEALAYDSDVHVIYMVTYGGDDIMPISAIAVNGIMCYFPEVQYLNYNGWAYTDDSIGIPLLNDKGDLTFYDSDYESMVSVTGLETGDIYVDANEDGSRIITFDLNDKEYSIYRLVSGLETLKELSEPEREDDNSDLTALDEDTVDSIYNDAVSVYRWFDMGTLAGSSDNAVEVDGRLYYKVTSYYDSYQAFEVSINEVFCGAVAERLMASELYVNVDGELYAISADRGSNIHYDGERRAIVQVSDEEILYNVEVDCSDESGKKWHEYYSFSLVLCEDGEWRFSEFGLTR